MSMIRVTLQWVIFIITVRGYNSQIGGEFWWLNDKITELKAIKPERPKFEKISEFDTDENDVIVFKEDSMFKRVNTKNASTENTFFFEEIKSNSNNNTMASNESKPFEVFAKPFHSTINATPTKANAVITKDEKVKQVSNEKPTEAPIEITQTGKKPRYDLRDRLTFGIVERSRHSTISWPRETKRGDIKPNIVAFRSEKFKTAEEACICVSKEACKRLRGVQATNRTHSKACSEESACCIPANELSSKIVFPGQTPKGKLPKTSTQRVRFIRSADTDIIPGQDRQSSGQKPRPIDLFWERVRTIDPKLPPSHRNPRIVTGDDDPYWNIKNVFAISNVSRPRHKISTGYATPDYGDYTMELPRPGLHQIYSEETPRPMDQSWGDGKRPRPGLPQVYSEETPRPMDQSWGGNGYSYGSYGSPVLDPRYDHVTISTSVSVRPISKPKAPDSEEIIDEEAEFANSYHATSQYQTFEDFKLPSLFRDKTKTRKTTERPQDYDSSESVAVAPNKLRPLELGYYGKKEQAYAKCGEVPFGDDDRNVYG